MDTEKKFPSDAAERFQVRMPSGLRDRIAASAKKNGRSMNTEIVQALEEKFPPPAIDVRVLSEFLESLNGVSAPDGDRDYLNTVNKALAENGAAWTVDAGWDGAVTFYPYIKKDDQPPSTPGSPPSQSRGPAGRKQSAVWSNKP